ncbi:PqqD family protein [Kaarinaea lacus]
MANSEIDTPAIPSAETLRRLAVSESGFVFDPVSGHNFTVNDTGLIILRRLQQTQDFSGLVQELQQEFDATPSDIERDVIEFIGMLREFVGE